METVNNIELNLITIIGFENESEAYKNVVKTILTTFINIINHSNILYDNQDLFNKISSLKLVKRDKEDHEYVEGTNTLFLSTTNAGGVPYNDEDIIIFLTHELVHFCCRMDNGFYKEFIGFDEFFTEFLTSRVVSKCGGIKMESHYREKVQGYFDKNDSELMRCLIGKLGFDNLLEIYLNRDKDKAISIIGQEVLQNINDYHDYYSEIINILNKPLRETRILLQTLVMSQEKNKLDENIGMIKQNINTLASKNKSI